MADFHVKIISSNRTFYEGVCHCLILPAVDGEMAVMAHHESEIVAVKAGEMRFQTTEDGPWEAAVVGQAFARSPTTVLCCWQITIEKPEEIDRLRAQEALERAKERLRQKQSISEYYSTRAAMARALVRLKETEIRKLGSSETDLSLFYACE